jgi:putative addiction module component (TIGR02574 family)
VSETTQQLIASALQLSPQERAVIANAILASLEDSPNDEASDVSQAWTDEIRSRIDDIETRRVNAIASSEAWKIIDGEIELRMICSSFSRSAKER